MYFRADTTFTELLYLMSFYFVRLRIRENHAKLGYKIYPGTELFKIFDELL